MAREIERKFLLRSAAWRELVDSGVVLRQGYLTVAGSGSASVRVRMEGEGGYLNIKSLELGIARDEYEYPIPLADAEQMLNTLCSGPQIIKRRYRLPIGHHCWEIDEFSGANAGLVVAEIELNHPDEPFERPDWLGEEVSADQRYYNIYLVDHPYSQW